MSYPAFKGGRPRGASLLYIPPATEDEFSTETVDHVAVARAVAGEHPRVELTHDEARVAALHLRQRNVPRVQVSIQLGLYERLIKEWEADAGLLGPEDLCTLPGCNRARAGRGYCAICLGRVRIQERQWKAAVADLATAA
ncbi:hypothetical protein [Streptomyces sp. NBC_01353]|uniref:hypothetical protein n=1 Tax=Streptomyces sp. NBC_01353 TaxID=2903835 RepID=UPI002E350A26|nr:hypothetical protein [Streptomyces sp. NBC_01353]